MGFHERKRRKTHVLIADDDGVLLQREAGVVRASAAADEGEAADGGALLDDEQVAGGVEGEAPGLVEAGHDDAVGPAAADHGGVHGLKLVAERVGLPLALCRDRGGQQRYAEEEVGLHGR